MLAHEADRIGRFAYRRECLEHLVVAQPLIRLNKHALERDSLISGLGQKTPSTGTARYDRCWEKAEGKPVKADIAARMSVAKGRTEVDLREPDSRF